MDRGTSRSSLEMETLDSVVSSGTSAAATVAGQPAVSVNVLRPSIEEVQLHGEALVLKGVPRIVAVYHGADKTSGKTSSLAAVQGCRFVTFFLENGIQLILRPTFRQTKTRCCTECCFPWRKIPNM